MNLFSEVSQTVAMTTNIVTKTDDQTQISSLSRSETKRTI